MLIGIKLISMGPSVSHENRDYSIACTERPGAGRFGFQGFLSVEVEKIYPNHPGKDGSLVGVDLGLESFATLSNGKKIAARGSLEKKRRSFTRVQRCYLKPLKTRRSEASHKVVGPSP